MDFKTFFIKKTMMGFFVSVTCICVAMAVLGLLYEPDARFGYEALFFPLFYGAIAILPGLVNYSKKELSLKQALVRKLISFILLEGSILFIFYINNALKSIEITVSLAVSILIVTLTAHFVLWVNDKRTAREFNSALKAMQNKNLNMK